MELNDIFVDGESGEGIYAVRFDNCEEDEYSRLMALWSDTAYTSGYYDENKIFFE